MRTVRSPLRENDVSRTIFITGVSSGIGHALANWYLDRGDRVFGCSRREPGDLVGRDRFDFESFDLRDPEATAAGVARLLNAADRVDLAILNAGMLSPIRDLADSDLASMRTVMDVNLWANKIVIDTLFTTVAAVGQVVTISSGAAVNGNRGWGAYSISKAALNMLVKLYAKEHTGTHFCALAPGIVDTAMQDELCSRPTDERFPSLETLREKRDTPDMPDAQAAAPMLAAAIDRLPERVESGEFADVRSMG
jgi:benzil reductase ((S)-benzoin forming)